MKNSFERSEVEHAVAESLKSFMDTLDKYQKGPFFKLYLETLNLIVGKGPLERICNYYKEIK